MSLEGGAHSPLLNFAAGESTSSSSSDVPRRVGTVLDEAAEEGPPEEQLRELASSPSCPSPASLLSSGRGNACDDGGLDGGASAEKHMVLSIPRRANGALNVSPVQLSDRSAQVSDRAPQHPPREEDEETVTEDEDEGEGGGPQEERGEGTNVTLAPIVDREEPNTSSRKRSNEESCSVGVGDEPASPTTAQERNIRARQDDIIIGDRIISPTSSSEKPNEETSPLIHSTKTAATSSSDPSVASASAPANQAPAAVPAAASAAFLRPHPAAAAAAAQYAAAAAAVNPFDPATAAAANAFGAAAAATAVVNPFATWNYAPTMTSSHPGSAMAAATLAAAQTLGGFRSAAPTPIGYVPVPVYYPAAAATVAQPVVHYPPGAATPYPVMSYSYPATTPTGASSPGVPTPSATVSATDVAAQRVPSTVAAPRLVANAPRQRRQRAKALPPSQLAESESLTKQASRRVAGAGAPENSGIGATTGDEFHKSMNRCVIREHVFPPTNWKEKMASVDESMMPEFHLLINFPDHVTRCRVSTYAPPVGRRYCVMCGKARLCSTGNEPVPSKSPANPGGTDPDEEGYIIPRQNKGVCTMCDVAVWTIVALNMEIKWCKGCKNFRPWPLFGDKLVATKCVRCRDRQKEKYKQKLKSMRADDF